MKKLVLSMASFVLAITFTACAGGANPELQNVKYMSDMEIKEVFNDKTIEGVSTKGKGSFNIFFKSDGTYSGTVYGRSLSGTWSVKDGTKCMNTTKGTFCRKHFVKDGKYYTTDKNGNIVSTFSSK